MGYWVKTGGWGGARIRGAGRIRQPLKTMSRQEARDWARTKLLAGLAGVLVSLEAKATGTKFLVYRDERGKFCPVTKKNAEHILATKEVIEVWERAPDSLAISEYLNRALGKVKDEVEVSVRHTLEDILAGNIVDAPLPYQKLDKNDQPFRLNRLPAGEPQANPPNTDENPPHAGEILAEGESGSRMKGRWDDLEQFLAESAESEREYRRAMKRRRKKKNGMWTAERREAARERAKASWEKRKAKAAKGVTEPQV